MCFKTSTSANVDMTYRSRACVCACMRVRMFCEKRKMKLHVVFALLSIRAI